MSRAARPTSPALGSIWTMQRSAPRSTAWSVPRSSAKALSLCRTRPPTSRPFNSSIRSTPTSRNRSANSINSGARSTAVTSIALLPSMYVRVLIEQGIDTDAIAVPQQAIQRNGGGGSEVFVLKDDNRVAIQAVRTGSVQDGQWFVTEGLKPGDKVVVEGFQKFAAGDKVRPQAWAEADASVAGSLPDRQQTIQTTR